MVKKLLTLGVQEQFIYFTKISFAFQTLDKATKKKKMGAQELSFDEVCFLAFSVIVALGLHSTVALKVSVSKLPLSVEIFRLDLQIC